MSVSADSMTSARAPLSASREGGRSEGTRRAQAIVKSAPLLLSLALILLAGCAREQKQEAARFDGAPVILISIDTLRADRLPIYGYKGVETPNLDALARDSVVFDNAWSHCPMTLPSHVSMLTGLLPTEHGVRNNAGFTWDVNAHPSLTTVMKSGGYATGAAVSSYVLRGESGMRAAFDHYDDAMPREGGSAFADHQRSGDETVSAALQWLDGVSGKPFFLLLHLYEPHVPYTPPEPFRSRYADAYDGEIATADAAVGRFLDSLRQRNLYDGAIIVLTSDHGEGLGDHGEQQHSILLYGELLRVPLAVKLPKSARAGERIVKPAALVDLAPSLAALLGFTIARGKNSADLFAPASPRNIYSETIYPYVQLGWSDLRSLVNERWHYIDGPRPELYDLTRDRRETVNVLAENRREAAAFQREAREYPPATSVESSVDPETASKLASLGYIGTARQRPDPRSLPNPREAIAVLDEMQRAFALADEGKNEEAVVALRAILSRQPRLQEVRVRLAEVLASSGRRDEAIEAYRNAIASSDVVMPDLLVALGEAYLGAGRLAEAADAARVARSGSPLRAAALAARVTLARGDLQGAIAGATEVERLAERPVVGMSAVRGEAYARMERPADAIAAYRREIADFPGNGEAYARLAVMQMLTGDRSGLAQTLAALDRVDATLAKRTRAALGM